jgi:hypothetical protein
MSQLHPRHDLFADWVLWGSVICSSIFPAGYVLVLEEREGKVLSRVWHELSHSECSYVKAECLRGIRYLRSITVRLDDPGMHNILYSRHNKLLTILDFENAIECGPNPYTTTDVEMNAIFGPTMAQEQGGGA